MVMKTLEWWVILLKCFDMCSWTPDDFDDENVEAWALALYKTDGCLDAIPFQFYRTTTIPEDWVGLDWKLIYLSISSLTAKVWAEATLWRLSTYAVPKMTVGHGWEAKLTGEVLILGRVIERLGLIIRILSMVNSGLFLTDVSNVVVKVYNLCRVSNYSNSRVRGYGQLEWPYCSPVRLFKMTCEMNWDFDLTTTGLWYEIQIPT